MFTFISNLSSLKIFLVIFSSGVGIYFLGAWLMLHLFSKRMRSGALAKGAEEGYKAIIMLTMLLMASSMIRLQSDHRNIEDLVEREAMVLLKLDRAFNSFDSQDGQKLRRQLRDYAELTVSSEWPLLERGGRSAPVSAVLDAMVRGSRLLDPQSAAQQIARSEIFSATNQLADLREVRLTASNSVGVPIYLWQSILIAIFVGTVVSWFLGTVDRFMLWSISAITAQALLLTVLIINSNLYSGENAVTPAAIERSIALLIPAPA